MAKPLRIAQIAPVAIPVTRFATQSVEQLVALLTDELVARGHDVTLFATADSETRARLHAEYRAGYERDEALWNWRLHESMNASAAYERAGGFDIIHSHSYQFALPFARLAATPSVHTHHVLPDPDVARLFSREPVHSVAVSHYQASLMPWDPPAAVIHHGIDVESFLFNPAQGSYLVFLGRIMREKGPLEAISLARQVGMRLLLAGPSEDGYYEEAVAPVVSAGGGVEYLGEVDHRARRDLLAHAAALVFPVQRPEPFGLTMIEAMACGTPVLALDRAAVPEIVEDGVSGCIGKDLPSLISRLPEVLSLDRAAVRSEAMRRFDFRRMVDGYEAVYAELAGSGVRTRPGSRAGREG